MGVFGIRRPRFPGDFFPLTRREFREEGVSVEISLHLCQVNLLGHGEEKRIDFTSPNDEDFSLFRSTGPENFIHGGKALCSLSRHFRSGEDDVSSPRQRPADGFPGLPAHDDRLPKGRLLEMGQISRKTPGDLTLMTDHPACPHRHDQGDRV